MPSASVADPTWFRKAGDGGGRYWLFSGWVRIDANRVSWQIVPANMNELMTVNPEKTTPVMLAMKKIVIADLEAAAKK
jgi:predicted 3-demethylubiquinone-9 3-methyltransferase (glyoxalase superfamily)